MRRWLPQRQAEIGAGPRDYDAPRRRTTRTDMRRDGFGQEEGGEWRRTSWGGDRVEVAETERRATRGEERGRWRRRLTYMFAWTRGVDDGRTARDAASGDGGCETRAAGEYGSGDGRASRGTLETGTVRPRLQARLSPMRTSRRATVAPRCGATVMRAVVLRASVEATGASREALIGPSSKGRATPRGGRFRRVEQARRLGRLL